MARGLSSLRGLCRIVELAPGVLHRQRDLVGLALLMDVPEGELLAVLREDREPRIIGVEHQVEDLQGRELECLLDVAEDQELGGLVAELRLQLGLGVEGRRLLE